jgi:hypothetical protein
MKLSSTLRVLALAGALAGCQLPLDHAACPCTQGWVCCATSNVCVAESADSCPGPSNPGGPGSDGGLDSDPGGGGGPVAVERLQPEHASVIDGFGGAIALLGDLAAVGAPLRNGHQGAVVVFERRGGGAGIWVRVTQLTAPDPANGNGFGTAVAFLAPDALLVGAPGAGGAGRAYLFRRTGTTWSWRQTVAPDLTGVPDDRVATVGFGGTLVADGGRAIILSGIAPQLYELTPAGVISLARLTDPGGQHIGAVAVRGSSAVATTSGTSSSAVYEFEEATGWVAPVSITSLSNPASLAFDGQRLAIWCRLPAPGTVHIFERTGTGWSAPVELAIPIESNALRAPQLAWHGDELILSAEQTNRLLGLWRVQRVAGAWQLDLARSIDQPIADASRLAVDGDRALVGLPHSIGHATLFHLDAGLTEESDLGLDDPPATSDGWLAAGSGQILSSSPFYDRVLWFAREAGGYRRRPSLVLDDNTQLIRLAVAGSHALVEQQKDEVGALEGIQPYELGDQDWTRGQPLTPPEPPFHWFPSSFAVDGDTAVVAAGHGAGSTSTGAVLVYSWSDGAWSSAATLETGLTCAPKVAIAGARIAAACNSLVRVFERVGATWHEMPAPPVPEPGDGIRQVMLAGDLVATASSRTAGYTIDVSRWADGHWRGELAVRSDRTSASCQTDACLYGLAGLASDRVVVYRDETSVARHRFADGAWLAEPPFVLPAAAQRTPSARVAAAALSGGDVIVSVTADGDGINTLANAIYVLPWR